MHNYYEILGVDPKASAQEIKKAYRELMKQYHPDKNVESHGTTRRAQLINEAYSTLKNPVKRLEYDNLMELAAKEAPGPETASHEVHGGHETTDFRCEKCGRKDTTLRVTIFLRIYSFLVTTYRRGWAHILCSRCRIKYSLLFNIEVSLLGWWGLPWGPFYTLDALLKNLLGGAQPTENNANLLYGLSYEYYLKSNYAEAFEALSRSHELRPAREKKDFLDYLKAFPRKKATASFVDGIFKLNPAWFGAPLLAVLLVLPFTLISSFDRAGKMDLQERNAKRHSVRTKVVAPSTTDIMEAAGNLGIDFNEIEGPARLCNDAAKAAASHVRESASFDGITIRGSVTIYNYELDSKKLSGETIRQHRKAMQTGLKRTLKVLRLIQSLPRSPSSADSRRELERYLEGQLHFMASGIYNLSVLETSIAYKKNSFGDNRTNECIMQLSRIGKDTVIKNWLDETGKMEQHSKLLLLIKEFDSDRKEMLAIKDRINLLDNYTREELEALDELSARLNFLENAIGGAFNDCLDAEALLAESEEGRFEKHIVFK